MNQKGVMQSSRRPEVVGLRFLLEKEFFGDEPPDYDRICKILDQLKELDPHPEMDAIVKQQKEEFRQTIKRVKKYETDQVIATYGKESRKGIIVPKAAVIIFIALAVVVLSNGVASAFDTNLIRVFEDLGNEINRITFKRNVEIPKALEGDGPQNIIEKTYIDIESALVDMSFVPMLPGYIPEELALYNVVLQTNQDVYSGLQIMYIDNEYRVKLYIYIEHYSDMMLIEESFNNIDYVKIDEYPIGENNMSIFKDSANHFATYWVTENASYRIVIDSDLVMLKEITESFQ